MPWLALRDPASPSSRVDVHDPVRCRWFAVGLFVAGGGVGIGLIASGQPLPNLGGLLLLAVLFAVAVHRVALFPSELAVTAEAAVLLAAIVAFRDGGPLVGPWCIAILAGPFDLVHWRQRSFVRMAYNAGNRIVATLAGAATFAIVFDAVGSAPEAVAAAALGASIAFAIVEGVVGTVLVRLRDRGTWLAAARVELPMERLTVPFGLIGACAGFLATEVGWWCVVPVLTPTLFLPELAIARARRAGFPFRHGAGLPFRHGAGLPFRHGAGVVKKLVVGLGPAAVALAVLALLVPVPPVPVLVALAAVALLLGFELRVGRCVPPVVAVLVGAAVVVSDGAPYAAASVVAVGAVATACVVARANCWWTPLLAGCSALAAAAVYDIRPSRTFALGAALGFELLVVALSGGVARFRAGVWTAPLVCAAVASASVWRAIGSLGALVFVADLATILVVTTFFGAPPWPSRVIGPAVARYATRAQPSVLIVAGVLSFCLGVAACAVEEERTVLVAAAATVAAAVASMAMTSVRQWRFAPRTRVRDSALVLACAVTVVIAYPRLALDGNVGSLVILAVSLAGSTAVAWPLAQLSAAVTVGEVTAGRDPVDR